MLYVDFLKYMSGTQLLPWILAFLMLGMGMTLTLEDFRRVFVYPKSAIVGLVSQIIFLPIFGFLIIQIVSMPPEIAVGVMIIASCPGGATSNLITYLSKGDVALSITLTACSSVITVFTIPFILNFSLDYILGSSGFDIQLNVWNIIKSLAVLTIIPVMFGMFVNAVLPDFTAKAEKFIAIASVFFILVALVIIVMQLRQQGNIFDFFMQAGVATFLLAIGSFGYGFILAQLMGLGLEQRICISIETGIQNNVLGITIASVFLKSPEMGTAAGVYAVFMCLTGFSAIFYYNYLVNKSNKTQMA